MLGTSSFQKGVLSRVYLTKILGILLLLSLAVVGLTAPSPAFATGTIRHVSPTGVNTGTCSTWATACNLQRAISIAVSGDQLWVKAGTYKPTTSIDRTVSFVLKDGVKIYGGFAGTESKLSQRNPATHVTILSGEIGGSSKNDNSNHVVYSPPVNATALLDGFTIKAGTAAGSFPGNWGGGMFIFGGSPTLSNLIFTGNSAVNGGGMFITSASNPTLTNVTFNGNAASFYGGGMYIDGSTPTLINAAFNGNSAVNGGGMYNTDSSSSTLTNVTFSTNPASDSGGGIYNENSNPTLMNATFSGNSAVNGGGIWNDTGNPTLTNITFNGNSAVDGGGMNNGSGSIPTLTNVTFSQNPASHDGGGMYNDDFSNPILMNVTFYDNSADSSFGGGMYNTGSSSPSLTDVTFDSNTAGSGAGIFNINTSNPTLTNITFVNNFAFYDGGGMYNGSASHPTLMNVTFSGNGSIDGGGMYNNISNPVIHNSIFWGDAGSEMFNAGSTPIIEDGLVAGGCPIGATCSTTPINADPKLGPLTNNGGFTKTMALKAGSPAIDAGNNSTCSSTDQRGVHRPQSYACDMGAYEAKAISFTSVPAKDGWVLESKKGSNVGGSLNTNAATFNVGDDSANRRYRGILSFNTASLPDSASIGMAQVWVCESGFNGNPFGTQGTLLADLVKPYFGSSLALAASDYQAAATVNSAGSFLGSGSCFWTPLNSPARSKINKTGTTQVRLRFSTDAYNGIAEYLSLYSGSASGASSRPHLIVFYYP